MGELLSQLEEKNDKIEKRLWTIERQVAFLNKMYAEMNKREADSNTVSEQASPHLLSFKELERKKGFLYRAPSGIDYPVICLPDVEQWLKTRGLDNLIGE